MERSFLYLFFVINNHVEKLKLKQQDKLLPKVIVNPLDFSDVPGLQLHSNYAKYDFLCCSITLQSRFHINDVFFVGFYFICILDDILLRSHSFQYLHNNSNVLHGANSFL